MIIFGLLFANIFAKADVKVVADIHGTGVTNIDFNRYKTQIAIAARLGILPLGHDLDTAARDFLIKKSYLNRFLRIKNVDKKMKNQIKSQLNNPEFTSILKQNNLNLDEFAEYIAYEQLWQKHVIERMGLNRKISKAQLQQVKRKISENQKKAVGGLIEGVALQIVCDPEAPFADGNLSVEDQAYVNDLLATKNLDDFTAKCQKLVAANQERFMARDIPTQPVSGLPKPFQEISNKAISSGKPQQFMVEPGVHMVIFARNGAMPEISDDMVEKHLLTVEFMRQSDKHLNKVLSHYVKYKSV